MNFFLRCVNIRLSTLCSQNDEIIFRPLPIISSSTDLEVHNEARFFLYILEICSPIYKKQKKSQKVGERKPSYTKFPLIRITEGETEKSNENTIY